MTQEFFLCGRHFTCMIYSWFSKQLYKVALFLLIFTCGRRRVASHSLAQGQIELGAGSLRAGDLNTLAVCGVSVTTSRRGVKARTVVTASINSRPRNKTWWLQCLWLSLGSSESFFICLNVVSMHMQGFKLQNNANVRLISGDVNSMFFIKSRFRAVLSSQKNWDESTEIVIHPIPTNAHPPPPLTSFTRVVQLLQLMNLHWCMIIAQSP